MIFTIFEDQNVYLRSYFGRYLKQKREGLQLSQKTVAKGLQLSEGQYRNIEAGKVKIKSKTIEALFSFLPLDPEELFEIFRISQVAYSNAVAKELSKDYPV